MLFQGNFLGLLTVRVPLLFILLIFSYSVSLGEMLSTVVWKVIFMCEHHCVAHVGLIFLVQRAFLVWIPVHPSSACASCYPLDTVYADAVAGARSWNMWQW